MSQRELLHGLAQRDADHLLALGTRIILPRGTVLFRLGGPADASTSSSGAAWPLTLPMQVRGARRGRPGRGAAPGQTVGWSGADPAAPLHAQRRPRRSTPRCSPCRGRAAGALRGWNPRSATSSPGTWPPIIGQRLQVFQAHVAARDAARPSTGSSREARMPAMRPRILLSAWVLFARRGPAPPPPATARATRGSRVGEERPEVPPPPFSDGIFPCSACHEDLQAQPHPPRS